MVSPSSFNLDGYSSEQIKKLYTLFINTMQPISIKHGGKLLKFQGDTIKSYFPKSSNKNDFVWVKEFLECCHKSDRKSSFTIKKDESRRIT